MASEELHVGQRIRVNVPGIGDDGQLGTIKRVRGDKYDVHLDWDDQPRLPQKLWWPCAEAIGAAAFLGEHSPSDFHEHWYRTLWGFAENHLIDHRNGGWHPELSRDLEAASTLFTGKPDLYHALQACLIPLFPATGSLTRVIPGGLSQS